MRHHHRREESIGHPNPKTILLFVSVLLLLIVNVLSTSKSESPTSNKNFLNVQEGDTLEFDICTVKPELLVKVNPIYPDSARTAGIEEMVMFTAWVGIDSFVEDYRIKKSILALD